jgi:CBS-domain-containing membrane protein
MEQILSWLQTGFERPPVRQTLIATFGASLGIGLVALVSDLSGSALLMAPLGATAVLVFGLPQSPLSQPRHVVGGHALSMVVGLICFFILGNGVIAVGLGTGLALGLMLFTRTVHPPAGANPLLLLLTGAPIADAALYIALPGVLGAILLYLVAAGTHGLTNWERKMEKAQNG